MDLDGDFAGAQLGGDLLVEEARDDQGHHLTLARRQRLVPPAQLSQLRPPAALRAVAVNRLLNGVQQLLVTEGLREKFHRPGLHGLHRHRHVAMTRDEDDRDRGSRLGEFALEIEATQPGQAHIEDEAPGPIRTLAPQELLRRPERLDPEPDRRDQAPGRFANRPIVVDDEDDGVLGAHDTGWPRAGRTNWNVAPWPAFGVAHNRPPCASMIDRLIESPIPRP